MSMMHSLNHDARWINRQRKARRALWRNSWFNFQKKLFRAAHRRVSARVSWGVLGFGSAILLGMALPVSSYLPDWSNVVQVPQARASPASIAIELPQQPTHTDAVVLKPSFSLTISQP